MSLLTNLTAYYKLDESSGNATDATGNGNTLTNSSVSYVAGKINNCASFSSTVNQKLDIASNLGYTSTSSWTISFWVNISTWSGYVFDYVTNSGAQREVSFYLPATGTFGIYTWNVDYQTAAAYSSSTWYHVVVTSDSSTITLYVNGSSVGTTSAGNTSNGSTNKLSVGCQYTAGTTSIGGKIDEFGVWTRVLSGTEISQLYNGGSGLQYPFVTYNGDAASLPWLVS